MNQNGSIAPCTARRATRHRPSLRRWLCDALCEPQRVFLFHLDRAVDLKPKCVTRSCTPSSELRNLGEPPGSRRETAPTVCSRWSVPVDSSRAVGLCSPAGATRSCRSAAPEPRTAIVLRWGSGGAFCADSGPFGRPHPAARRRLLQSRGCVGCERRLTEDRHNQRCNGPCNGTGVSVTRDDLYSAALAQTAISCAAQIDPEMAGIDAGIY